MTSDLTPDLAARLASITLGHVAREYPYAVSHVVVGPDDLAVPRTHHPIFHGSFDWHSCVHGHWLLARLLRHYPELAAGEAIRAHFDQAFTNDKVAGELAYLSRPSSAGFERPYGWAWLLKLAAELRSHDGEQARVWDLALRPLASVVARRLAEFLPRADYPVRTGVHSNTAFALALAHDYAVSADADADADADDLTEAIRRKASAWYGADAQCPAWEPSGEDFLSPALVEAELMRRVLTPAAFTTWFGAFLPAVGSGEPATLFAPVRISDRGDGKIAHLDGLNLSRAWCWRGIAASFPSGSAVRTQALDAMRRHLDASLPHIGDDYMGEHWLASFALLALDAPQPPSRPGT